MFHKNTDTGYDLVLRFFFWSQFLPFWFFLRLIGVHIGWFKPLKTSIFKEPAPWWKGLIFFITNLFVMEATGIRITQIPDKSLVNVRDQVVFHGMRFFLAARVFLLLLYIFWTLDRPFGSINHEID